MNERLYRYLELGQAVSLAYHLAIGARGSKNLMKQLEVVFIKHRKALSLDNKLSKMVRNAYSITGGSPTLFAALDDPNIEVPGVDAKIPRMDKVPGGDAKRAAQVTHDEHKQISHHH